MNHICGTCKFYKNVDGEFVCLNENSFDTYGLETQYDDGCDEHECKEED